MNEKDLKERAEELERKLDLQLNQLKRDSEVWLKVGGTILVIGFIAYRVTKARRHKRNPQKLDKVEQEGIWDKRERRRPARKSSFFSTLKNRLFLTLLSYGEVKLMDELNKRIRRNEK